MSFHSGMETATNAASMRLRRVRPRGSDDDARSAAAPELASLASPSSIV